MTPDTLRKLLSYDPETGELVWLTRDTSFFSDESHANRWNARYANTRAFQTVYYGYLHGHILKKHYYAHRVCWAIYYGKWPADQIDHINGNRADNRISNLRDVSHSDNQKNTKLRHDNKSGVPGIDWKADCALWRARASRNGKRYLIGYFKNLDDAIAARMLAQSNENYHANHGRYAVRHIP